MKTAAVDQGVDTEKADRQFLGTAGTYYVMAELAFQNIHASCTFGNAPYVDILASAPDGSRTLAIQVKTAFNAVRRRGRGEERKPDHLEWPIGRKIAQIASPSLFLALVDAKKCKGAPDIYVVPSTFIRDHFEGRLEELKWVRLHIGLKEMDRFKNNWTLVREALGYEPVGSPDTTEQQDD